MQLMKNFVQYRDDNWNLYLQNTTLKVSVFGVLLIPILQHRTEYSASLHLQSECGEIADQNNSEYEHFFRQEITSPKSLDV